MVADLVHGRLIDSVKFVGTVNSHEQLVSIKGSAGDVLFCEDIGTSYLYTMNYDWEPIACADAAVPAPAKVISHCPNCGGRLSRILPESRTTGHQVCEWCMSTINIYC